MITNSVSNISDCEQPLWETRGLANAIYCCSITDWDEVGTSADARNHAITTLAVLIRERAETVERLLFKKHEAKEASSD